MERILRHWIAALGAATLLAACGGGGGVSSTATAPPPVADATMAQTATKMQDMSTFVAAMKYVDSSSLEKLMPAMENPGSMTVFAPSNEAFDQLAVELMGPGSKGTDLLNEDMKDDVRDILKNHMLAAKVLRADMSLAKSMGTSLSGNAAITITLSNGVVTITDGQGGTAVIKLSDIVATNGVLHLIDRIIKPPKEMLKKKSIVDIASKTPALSSLVAALGFASNNGDLVTLLSNTGTFTVFAPTNQAFDALAVELLGAGKKAADLLVPANKDLVRAVLQYHVLGSVVKKSAIPLGKPINPVLAGDAIFKIDKVKVAAAGNDDDDDDDDKNALIITDGRNRNAEIIATNIRANNGVVHVIDKVILPADKDIVQTAIASAPEFSILV
ncbi:MAG: fasciclin domain-containing protein, partial [Burkholderiaceae bacterium]